MTQEQAEELIFEYAVNAGQRGLPEVISEVDKRYRLIENPSIDKTMRWLGFCQGYLVAEGMYSLDDVKEHSAQYKD
jgi:hypothetical protein